MNEDLLNEIEAAHPGEKHGAVVELEPVAHAADHLRDSDGSPAHNNPPPPRGATSER
jgi:hypothetical protein